MGGHSGKVTEDLSERTVLTQETTFYGTSLFYVQIYLGGGGGGERVRQARLTEVLARSPADRGGGVGHSVCAQSVGTKDRGSCAHRPGNVGSR